MDFPVIDLVKTGKKLEALCKKANLKPSQIERELKLSCVQTVYKWFAGKNLPSIENFYALSIMLGVTMEELLVVKKVPDHSRFWQKNVFVIPVANPAFQKRILLYAKYLSCMNHA